MKVKLVANVKFSNKGRVFRKGDVFELDPLAFSPTLMQDLTPKPTAPVELKLTVPHEGINLIPHENEKIEPSKKKKGSGVGA